MLKPNDEYGGKGVRIGWETAQDAWDAALAEAVAEPMVVQERVQIASEPFSGAERKGCRGNRPPLVDSDPFLFSEEGTYTAVCAG